MKKPIYVLIEWPESQQFVGCNEKTYPVDRGGYFVETDLYNIAKANPTVNGEALEAML